MSAKKSLEVIQVPTLYELKDKYLKLLEMATEEDAALFQDTLESLEGAIEDKAEKIVCVLKEMEGDINTLKAEEKRLKERRQALEKKKEHLRWYLQDELEVMNIPRLKTARFTISLRDNAPKVNVIDEDLIPFNFIKTSYAVDKKAVKEALESGQEVEGATLVKERGISIR